MNKDLLVAQKEFWRQQNALRIGEQKKQFDYYSCNYEAVQSYLKDALLVTYSADDLKDFQMPVINFTKKLINQLAVVYRESAKRKIINSDGTENEDLTKYYNSIVTAKINSVDNQALRMAKLSNASLTGIRIKNDKIDYLSRPSWLYNIVTDDSDPYTLLEVSYDRYYKKGDDIELWTIFWTDKQHYRARVEETIVDGNSLLHYTDPQPVPGMKDMVNPYGIIPYSGLVLEEYGDSFWGQGKTDVVSMNEQINFLLCNLINEQLLLAGSGTLLAVNLGLSSKSNQGETTVKRVRAGRKHPIVVEGVSKEMSDPRLEHVNANPVIAEVKDSIDWIIKSVAVSQGLNPNSFLQDVKATSGYSKIVDSLEQSELRKDDIEPCRAYEDDRFNRTRKINNYYAQTVEGKAANFQEIPEDVYLSVDFTTPGIPK